MVFRACTMCKAVLQFPYTLRIRKKAAMFAHPIYNFSAGPAVLPEAVLRT
ncbi:MAG: 3-phosphoserine/phosphohydroxythreonine transaminase, partial [Neisseria sp.]|nr:3-phosphoserine/phosphohydroxythreonine transaminase [Neisseria sp.]